MTSASYPHHLPRVLVDVPLTPGFVVPLSDAQAHYLRNVLRLQQGALLRIFNPSDGEFLAKLVMTAKKTASLEVLNLLRGAGPVRRRLHLVFSPIKKDRMEWMIEKAVELGVTDFHPVLMRRTVVRDLKSERLQARIIEAAEQCERMDVPIFHDLLSLPVFVRAFDPDFRLYAALERSDARPLKGMDFTTYDNVFYLVGPEGGFDPEEVSLLTECNYVVPVMLGPLILRAETAALYGICLLS